MLRYLLYQVITHMNLKVQCGEWEQWKEMFQDLKKITSTKQIVKIGKRELQQVLEHFLG